MNKTLTATITLISLLTATTALAQTPIGNDCILMPNGTVICQPPPPPAPVPPSRCSPYERYCR